MSFGDSFQIADLSLLLGGEGFKTNNFSMLNINFPKNAI